MRGASVVDIFGEHVPVFIEPLQQQVLRYVFVRSPTGWRFVRQQLLYAT
jgi:hypothetical protein